MEFIKVLYLIKLGNNSLQGFIVEISLNDALQSSELIDADINHIKTLRIVNIRFIKTFAPRTFFSS